MHPQLLLLLALLGVAAARPPPVCPAGAPVSPAPRWFHRPLPGKLGRAWVHDGISPFLREGIRVSDNNMQIPLVGRGAENPLRQDAFGAGMRISTRYAYLGGKVCAWLRVPEPESGTIAGMYLIDSHPKGSTRGGARWREADLEWLGAKPSQVQTSVFEQGQEQPGAQEHDLQTLLGASQRDWVHYCIAWDLHKPGNKHVTFTARSQAHPQWVVLRKWTPSSTDVAKFWSEPLRAVFTFWSNNHIVGWSGPYNIADGRMLWLEFKDVTFRPKGPAFCPKPDGDLEPMQ